MTATGVLPPLAAGTAAAEPWRPRLSAEARRVLLGSTLRSVAHAPAAAHEGLVERLRGLGGADELVEAYHFRRGTLTRWAAELPVGEGVSSVAAVDAAVRARLQELGVAAG